MYFFILKEILHWFLVFFSCLINALFSIILMENLVAFSNALSIFELMLCNRNLTKFDILTLLSSDCRAWAQKLSKHLKRQQKMFFVFILPSPTSTSFFGTLNLTFLKIISYFQSLINLCDVYHFKKYQWLS